MRPTTFGAALVAVASLGLVLPACSPAPTVDDVGPTSSAAAPARLDPAVLSALFARPRYLPERWFTNVAPNRFEVRPPIGVENACRGDGPRLVPALRDNRVYGFRIFSIRAGSLCDQAGLKNGDTVVAANGMPLTSTEKALEAYSRLEDADEIRVDLERAGRRMTLTCEIK